MVDVDNISILLLPSDHRLITALRMGSTVHQFHMPRCNLNSAASLGLRSLLSRHLLDLHVHFMSSLKSLPIRAMKSVQQCQRRGESHRWDRVACVVVQVTLWNALPWASLDVKITKHVWSQSVRCRTVVRIWQAPESGWGATQVWIYTQSHQLTSNGSTSSRPTLR